MLRLFEAVEELQASRSPFLRLLGSSGSSIVTYRDFFCAVAGLQAELATGVHGTDRSLRVGVLCGNTPEFVVADVALLCMAAIAVPVPIAFSHEQARALLHDVDVCLVDAEGQQRLDEWGHEAVLASTTAVHRLHFASLAQAQHPLQVCRDREDWICKVMHTSGTTSRPKGVKIRAYGLDALISSLREVMPSDAFRRTMSLAPFSLLIEQTTSIYMVLASRGELTIPPAETPALGTSPDAAEILAEQLPSARATALVATPAFVEVLLRRAERALRANESIARRLFGADRVPLICCGGAPARAETLRALAALGIQIYEGYGLSENSSVVCWNRPGACRIGTVGQALPHVALALGSDGELLVRSSSMFAGYSVEDPSSCSLDADGWLHTGDLAQIDDAGYVTIVGRKKSVIITSAGRNVAPEWVEAQYKSLPEVVAAAAIDDGDSALRGLFLVDTCASLERARAAISDFGLRQLSAVERIHAACLMPATQQIYSQFFTITGRPRRQELARASRQGAFEYTFLYRAPESQSAPD